MDRQWQSSGVLSGGVLENLSALNRDYLDTLARTRLRRPSRRATRALPQQVATAVSQLDSARRVALARSPFSLFDARFIDGAFWERLTFAVHEPQTPATCHCLVTRFSHAALFFAWHLARSDPFGARILLGMSDRTLEVFGPLTLIHLQQLATRHPSLITPRWAERETVWRILLGAARRGPTHLADIRMFGIQLIAGDLAASPS